MNVSEVLERISFAISTQYDLSGNAVGNLFSNKNMVQQLKFALDRFADYTKAIEAVYSFSVDSSNSAILEEPPLVLRSQAYRFVVGFVGGVAFPIMLHDLNSIYGNFPVQIQGVPTWGLAWDKLIYLFPQAGYNFNTTTLSSDITATDTDITVVSASGMPTRNGRVTIGSEKIFYSSRSDTQLLDCTRGIEGTTAASHSSGATVNENNCWVYYYKRHFAITVNADDSIDTAVQNLEMEIYDEFIEPICDYTAYKLLSKIDTDRAKFYKTDFDSFLQDAKDRIEMGRANQDQTSFVRDPYWFENQMPYGLNI